MPALLQELLTRTSEDSRPSPVPVRGVG
jgi:hypothetical protein